jgi:hypothetical protein
VCGQILFLFWQQIEHRLENLDNELEMNSLSSASSYSNGQDLDHLQCLVDFVKDDLGELLKLRSNIVHGNIKKITFPDLWHLFTPGDVVVSVRNGRERAFQVHSVSTDSRRGNIRAPRRVRVHRDEDSSASESEYSVRSYASSEDSDEDLSLEDHHPVRLQCFYMDFDGNQVGSRFRTLPLKFYPGEREITRLEAYPVRFHDPGDDILGRLRKRGERYITCQGHKTYQGPMPGSAEEIEGEIYVDFKTSFRMMRLPKPEFGHPPTRTLGRQVEDKKLNSYTLRQGRDYEYQDRRIRAFMYNDMLLENTRMDNYIQSNRDLLRAIDPQEDIVSPERLILLPSDVPAYVFRSRRWCKSHLCLFYYGAEKANTPWVNSIPGCIIRRGYR